MAQRAALTCTGRHQISPGHTRQHDRPRTSKPVSRRESAGGFDSRPPPLWLTCGFWLLALRRLVGHCTGLKNRGTSVVQRCVYLQVRPVPKRLKKPPKAALQTSCKHPITTLPETGTTMSTCGRHSRLAEILLPPLGVSDGLVGEVGDVAIDGLGVDKAHGFLVAGLAEKALAGPEHDG